MLACTGKAHACTEQCVQCVHVFSFLGFFFFSKAFAVQVFTFIFVRGPRKTFPHIFDDVFLVDIFDFFELFFLLLAFAV